MSALHPLRLLSALVLTAVPVLVSARAAAQVFVEYPGHPATYGDHSVPATWAGGPSAVTVSFLSDPAVLHGDGNGQSQRTARNTLSYSPPSSATNPQDYDDLRIIAAYGSRLPLLQEMAANGTATLRYAFASAITAGFDLFLTDVDTSDSLVVTAWSAGGAPLDMSGWTLRARGDLSLYKNTGAGYSPIVAPNPNLNLTPAALTLTAANDQNYNRSLSIVTAPAGAAIGRIDITFTGIQNSASRADGGTGSHIYVGLCTPAAASGAPAVDWAPGIRLITPNPAPGGRVGVGLNLERPTRIRWSVFDVTGRRVARPFDSNLGAGNHELRWDGRGACGAAMASGLYLLRLERDDTPEGWTQRILLLR